MEPGQDGTGPSLYGVVGRDIASESYHSYTDALTAEEGNWTPDRLNLFLENPRSNVPGTAMSFAGIRDVEDRAAMVAYLDSLDD